MKRSVIIICCLALAIFVQAQGTINLPAPKKTGGKPLMEALNDRQSSRSYVAGKEMDNQTLSNLLWAAFGFNRSDKRTAPSSQNRQEIEIYVMKKDGIYLYDAKENRLNVVAKGDYLAGLGSQEFSKEASVNLIYVADLDKNSRDAALTNTGYISQNVYLFCASEGLGTVARGSFNKELLPTYLKLTDKQVVTLVQPVGYIK